MVAVTKEHLQVPGYKLVHSIRGDGGQSDSICPLKAFSVGATYFPFTVSSSSSRLGELRGRAGGQAEGSQAGRQRGQPGVGGGRGPTWRGLRGPREGTPRVGPDALPKSPRRRRRGSATAHHVLRGPRRRRRRLTASLRAVRLAGGARAQTVDRRNRPAAAAAATEGAGAGAGTGAGKT